MAEELRGPGAGKIGGGHGRERSIRGASSPPITKALRDVKYLAATDREFCPAHADADATKSRGPRCSQRGGGLQAGEAPLKAC
jgi:hypothetical protein